MNERDEPSVEQLRDELERAEQKIEALKDVAPYDSIARMAATTKGTSPRRTVAGSIDFLMRLARINDPRAELQPPATFLDVEPDQGWEKACARIVFHAPKRAREAITWTNEERAEVEQIIERRAFFAGYTWTSDE